VHSSKTQSFARIYDHKEFFSIKVGIFIASVVGERKFIDGLTMALFRKC
jgi:hypothetical protein